MGARSWWMVRGTKALAVVALAAAMLVAAGLGSPANASAPQPYIVTLRSEVVDPAGAALALTGKVADTAFSHALSGFVVELDAVTASVLALNPLVESVEPDLDVALDQTQTDPPSYGIDRIDQRTLPLSDSFTYTATGRGVTAYIIDTGIRATHRDFGGRVQPGTNTVNNNTSLNDCNGHGTHVAGTLGGATYGVAKEVTLVSVRVFGCNDSTRTSRIIAGLDWVVQNHTTGAPAVANLSFGGSRSTSLDTAVRNLVKDGVVVGTSAGNQNSDACRYSPGRVSDVVTVAATDSDDERASFSNYGTCVDLFAPGIDIVSASNASDTGSRTESGTSMSVPHTLGVAAQYLQENPTSGAAAVQAHLRATATRNAVDDDRTSNNDLLFTNH